MSSYSKRVKLLKKNCEKKHISQYDSIMREVQQHRYIFFMREKDFR